MTNRSDRRALTLILPKVFSETVDLMRRARANFHRGPEEQFFHEEAESMTATIVLNPGKNLLHFSGGTIYNEMVPPSFPNGRKVGQDDGASPNHHQREQRGDHHEKDYDIGN